MSITPRLLLPAVSVGDELPPLSVDITPTLVVLGAIASRDWRPMHHDYRFATERNGVQDIFLNTPNQAAWIERFLTDWGGPHARPGRMTFRMRSSVFPGDQMTMTGTVTSTEVDAAGCGWVGIDVRVDVALPDGGAREATTCAARLALPTTDSDNPWTRTGDNWRP